MELEKELELNKQSRIEHTILLQTVRDILINNKLITYEDFNKEYNEHVDRITSLSNEQKKELYK
ncbi:hypothetical protein ACPOM7_19185 [Peribacillus castrilensis]|uniref:hypothetical protein n=1 Tax=Peribacillus TaxID=2675229 RepID=UPI0030FA92CB